MAGGRSYGNPRFRSPILVSTLCLLSISLFFIFFSPSNLSRIPTLNPTVDYSFLSSLHKFLSSKPPHRYRDDTVISTASESDVKKLDEMMWRREFEKLHELSFNSVVRVYVYEMPDKFTYNLLELFWTTYKETVNLTSNGSPVHRLIEQHSVGYWLWADLIAPESQRLLKNVFRVYRQEDADLFYIPFFTTISYFLLEKQQCKSLYRVKL